MRLLLHVISEVCLGGFLPDAPSIPIPGSLTCPFSLVVMTFQLILFVKRFVGLRALRLLRLLSRCG